MAKDELNTTIFLNPRVREPVTQLCANLYLSGAGPVPEILAVTSAEAGEGRSSLALALGAQMTQMLAAPVLVVEANLRAPAMASLVGLPADAPGLADMLADDTEAAAPVHPTGPGGPDLLPAGTVPDDDLMKWMTRDRLEKVFRRLHSRYPFLVVETPPINPYSEGLMLIGVADGVIMTVRSGVTSRETVSLAVKRIESINGKFLGLVLNQKQFPLPEWLYRRL